MGNFQELKVWQRAKELAVFLYKLTGKGTFTTDLRLKPNTFMSTGLSVTRRF